jgi:hypothetical protein
MVVSSHRDVMMFKGFLPKKIIQALNPDDTFAM